MNGTYHQGPLIPYLYACAEEVKSVAAHVHAETMPAAINPGLTLLDADVNSSDEDGLKLVYRPWMYDRRIMNPEKKKPLEKSDLF
jgi:hypothetical protein